MPDHEFDLTIKALEFLLFQYRTSQRPCLALTIAKHYRILEELCTEEFEQLRYQDYANYWLNSYINSPQHSVKKKNLLLDILANFPHN